MATGTSTITLGQADSARGHQAEKVVKKYLGMVSDIPTIGSREIWDLKASGTVDILLIDVRQKEEIEVSRIPGAITRKEFEKLDKESVKQKMLVPYCTAGLRSGIYCRELIKSGFSSEMVRNGEGIILWTHYVGSLTTCDGTETKRVHTYGSEWDLCPEGYETIQYPPSIRHTIRSSFSLIRDAFKSLLPF